MTAPRPNHYDDAVIQLFFVVLVAVCHCPYPSIILFHRGVDFGCMNTNVVQSILLCALEPVLLSSSMPFSMSSLSSSSSCHPAPLLVAITLYCSLCCCSCCRSCCCCCCLLMLFLSSSSSSSSSSFPPCSPCCCCLCLCCSCCCCYCWCRWRAVVVVFFFFFGVVVIVVSSSSLPPCPCLS